MDREKLIRETLPVCRREARRWSHMVGLDVEDLAADGAVGLVRASYRFDPSRGVPFRAFALPFIRGAILDTVRAWVRRRTLRDGSYALDVELEPMRQVKDVDVIGNHPPDPLADIPKLVEYREAFRMIGTLPDQERIAILRMQVDGASGAEVGEELGVSDHRVYMLVQEGTERLRRRAA